MNAAVYARVSTQRQTQQQSLEGQLEQLLRVAHEQGWSVLPEAIFRDDGFSGANLNRPGLSALRAKVAEGAVRHIFVTEPDRLARNYVHQTLLLEEFANADVAVTFLERPMASHDPHDQLLLQIRGAVAQYERSLITSRTRQGRQKKLEAGLLLPWTRAPYGYRLNPDKPRDPSGVRIAEDEAALVRELFALYLAPGGTLHHLSVWLSERGIASPNGRPRWGPHMLRLLLSNPAYIGLLYTGRYQSRPVRRRRSPSLPVGRARTSSIETPREAWVLIGHVPAIIDEATFNQVQAKLAQNKKMASRHNIRYPYLLRALVSCQRCGLACIGRCDNRYRYYVCSGKRRPFVTGLERCASRMIRAEALDELVWNDLCQLLTHPEVIQHALTQALGGAWLPQELQARRTNLKRGEDALERQLARLTEAYLAEVIPLTEYQQRREALQGRKRALEDQERRLSHEVDRKRELTQVIRSVEAFCERTKVGLTNASFEQKRTLVELLVDRVFVNDESVEIHYVIPTDPKGEKTIFCHLCTDYLEALADQVAVAHGVAIGQADVETGMAEGQERAVQVFETDGELRTVAAGPDDQYPQRGAASLQGFVECMAKH